MFVAMLAFAVIFVLQLIQIRASRETEGEMTVLLERYQEKIEILAVKHQEELADSSSKLTQNHAEELNSLKA